MAFPEDLDPLIHADIIGATEAAVDSAAREVQKDISRRVRRTVGSDMAMSNIPYRMDVDVGREGVDVVVELSPAGLFAIAFAGTSSHRIIAKRGVLEIVAGDVYRRAVQHPGTGSKPLPEAEESHVDAVVADHLDDDLEAVLP